MSNLDFKVALWELLMQIRPRRKVNDSQISIRCPFCGDSIKSKESTHLGIKINMKEDEPVLFNCFRCSASGVLTPSVLRTIGLNDLQINSGLLSYNNAALKNMPHQIGIRNNDLNLTIPKPDENDERNIIKKKYIESRIGIRTTFEDLRKLKVIFRLGQFLRENNIDTITVGKEKAIMLNNDYIGFLSTKGEFINFRQVYEGSGKRYEKYSVFKNLDNTRKFYTIPNEIDLLSNKKVTINIAEGVFDILGVYYHLHKREMNNMIYTAVQGSGYPTVIKYFIQMGIIDNVDVNIYSDDDKGTYFYKNMVKELSPWVNEFKIFYNEKSKDFGVPKDQIKVIQKRL